ncbi:glycosyltransferase family 2 protein [Rhizobium sp. BE258]|uniref:glycosyltransferase family 2 protein n=1 Tax=Rhizobium sp. BE258 TaxID=2817722 RepID=UPI002864B8F2|nr:glycosyltransferase family 2 protein [Rhizobium sp. BE258]MDR7145204.1 glycosyltransferase involved in cell wall biosynthesis [Rhizobium sp. BE258]
MKADISVVIPVRNRPEAILSAINSVLQQTVSPKEVLVIDDASTDDTAAVVRTQFGQAIPVKLIELPENRGGGFARNAGIDAASGSMIAFLDSDDLWLPDKLMKQLQIILGRETDRLICFSNLIIDYGDHSTKSEWNRIAFDGRVSPAEYMIDLDQVVQTSTLLMPSSVAREIRFADGLRRHQDVDFVLRAAHAGVSFVYCDEPLVVYSADPAVERTSKRRNVNPSLVWMKTAQAYLSEKDIASFYHKHLYEMEIVEAPVSALNRAVRNVVAGRASLGDVARRTARAVLSDRLKSAVRRVLRRNEVQRGI